MKQKRRMFCTWLASSLLVAMTGFSSLTLASDKYPERNVTLVVPFAAGGSSDTATRILAEQLSYKWGQSVIVENRPGANGSVGARYVARSAADGHTLLVTPVSIGTIELFMKNPGFDRDKDLIPVSQFAKGDYVLAVGPDLPVETMSDFVDYAKANPDEIFHGAFGGASQLAFTGFSLTNDIMPTNVNYRGEVLVLNALMSGEVQAALVTLVGARPFIESGRIKAIGMPTAEKSLIAQDILTADESGAPGFYADFWFGLMAPAATSPEIQERVANDLREILSRSDIQERFQSLGLLAAPSTPEEFGELIRYESERWVETAKHAGIEPQ